MSFISCGDSSKKMKLAEGIYEKEDMVNILVEMHLVEAAYRSGALDEEALTQTRHVQQLVLERMGSDTLQFDESYAYYADNSEKLKEIYDLVSVELTKKKLETMDKHNAK